jgi:hypothetical protein
MPHVADVDVSHCPPALQHPIGHDAASHTHLPLVVSHCCPVAQAPHAAPPAPHEPLVSLA